ncbi:FAD-dependent monooxygenase [Pseudonocardia humida]|uniref:FAD-dependent monooxygenase n=1 Tax=Pseudonocardia humida TaxID=2800819 RepID=A0ABT0ZW73_9PSEU|nr:FAD-dependent monooxygenase [Pseudonocardia humida]MCO1654990.1 FAD-dependent monooxygenase [Pseudonocardia humida]
MNGTKVLVSGASIAGPTLAYWLARRGADVTVVEQAPRLRGGGHGVDFRGAQMELLDRMGITDDVRAHQTAMGTQTIIDATGRPIVELPALFFSGEVEITRGNLARILYERTRDHVEYVFDDSVTALTDTGSGVDVEFRRSSGRTFDLVIGADGMHSKVRALAFGPESRFAVFRGYYMAGFDTPNFLDLDHVGLVYNEPGRAVMVSSDRDPAVLGVGLLFESERLHYDRHDTAALRRIVAERFAGVGWETPRLLEHLREAPDPYFEPLEQIELDRWSTGRIALLGDAAWCAGPGGSGTGLAMMGAYVLAAELAAASDDHTAAFARYQQVLAKAAAKGRWQAKGAGAFLAPPTPARIRRRNRTYRLLSSRIMSRPFARILGGAANAVTLDAYPRTAEPSPAR